MKPNYFGYDVDPKVITEMGRYLLEEIQKSSGIPKKYFGNADEIEKEEFDNRLLLMI